MPPFCAIRPKCRRNGFVWFSLSLCGIQEVMRFALATMILAVSALAAVADPPDDADAIDAGAALACVAARYQGEALRVKEEDDGLVQEVRWLTPAGNVLEIEITGPARAAPGGISLSAT
jgi:hypothetical protein